MSLVTNLDNIFKKGVIGNVRKAQEDSHDIALKTPNGDVFVVCDGMGGHVGGKEASKCAVDSIKQHLEEEKYDDPIAALDVALKRANDQIMGYASEHPEYKGMGTTACVLLLQNDSAYLAHVGDSRIYLYHGYEKTLNRITKDHSYVQKLVDEGQITEAEAETHSKKNRILKALGVRPNLQPSFNSGRPKNGDIFLICSDGLSGMISDSTIEKVLQQDNTLETKGEWLIDLAMQGETVRPGGQDNCTLELIQIDNSPWAESDERGFEYYNPAAPEKQEVSNMDEQEELSVVSREVEPVETSEEEPVEISEQRQVEICEERPVETRVEEPRLRQENMAEVIREARPKVKKRPSETIKIILIALALLIAIGVTVGVKKWVDRKEKEIDTQMQETQNRVNQTIEMRAETSVMEEKVTNDDHE